MSIIGIRREDKSAWERRTPLVPEDVARIVSESGIAIQVQASPNRCFPDDAYREVGAIVTDDLSGADVIIGVKEIPPDLLRSGKTYLFFSHTMKGQPYNMPMLRRILDLGCTLLDYELMTDDEGIRTIAFGRHAGLAGAIDTLSALGRRLAGRGHVTPLGDLSRALEHGEVAPALAEIEAAGRRIAEEGLPEEISPVTIAVTGEGGKVWGGALEVLDALPARRVPASEVASRVRAHRGRAHEIWSVSYGPGDLVEPVDPGHAYTWEDYAHHPEKYRARFGADLPFLTAIIHGIFWAENYPRFILREDVRRVFAAGAPPKLQLVTDITCDLMGSNECLTRLTEPGNPIYVYDPGTGETRDGLEGEGLAVQAVEILPAEIPVDASRHFSEILTPLIPHLAREDVADRPDDPAFPASVRRSYLAVRGRLLDEWSERLREPLRRYGEVATTGI